MTGNGRWTSGCTHVAAKITFLRFSLAGLEKGCVFVLFQSDYCLVLSLLFPSLSFPLPLFSLICDNLASLVVLLTYVSFTRSLSPALSLSL